MFRSLLPATVLVAAVVAGCSGSAGSTAPASAAPVITAPASAALSGSTIAISDGGFFVGPDGKTLYTFDKDVAGKSNCTGQCLTNWPALIVANASAITPGTGLTAADFTTVTRDDGTLQVAFKQIPLYYFAGDSKPGDKNGDGVGGIWHLATTASLPITVSAAPSAAASAAGSAASPPASVAAAQCTDAHYQTIPCPSAGGATATTVSVSSAGYLVAANGMALYTYDKDSTANVSSCSGDCLTNWPALTVAPATSVSVGTGVDQEDFATFTRTDSGASQVTYYGKALYFFVGDTAAGQTNGDGVGAVWHLAKPQ